MKEDFIDDDDNNNNNNNHMAFMELGRLLTCFGLTYLEDSLMVSPGFFCLLVCTFLVFSEIYYGTVCMLHPVSSVVLYFVQNLGYI